MDGKKYIQRKQVAWATRTGHKPVGSTFQNEGEKNYLENLDDNIFQGLANETRIQLENGDGGETKDFEKNGKHYRPKINALHSSSALVVNLFQYWQKRKDVHPIAYACNLYLKHPADSSPSEIKFEEKFQISKKFSRAPNIDIAIIDFQSKVFAIESKFTEPYASGKHTGIDKKYIDDASFWNGLSNLYELAQKICPDNNKFHYLDAAQLIKHILGLKNKHKKSGFQLLYLWYDVVGQDGAGHRKEIEQFAEIAKRDSIQFSHMTYQEVIIKLAQNFYAGNEEYCNYMKDRYL
jgi:hypothetical protein